MRFQMARSSAHLPGFSLRSRAPAARRRGALVRRSGWSRGAASSARFVQRELEWSDEPFHPGEVAALGGIVTQVVGFLLAVRPADELRAVRSERGTFLGKKEVLTDDRP